MMDLFKDKYVIIFIPENKLSSSKLVYLRKFSLLLYGSFLTILLLFFNLLMHILFVEWESSPQLNDFIAFLLFLVLCHDQPYYVG